MPDPRRCPGCGAGMPEDDPPGPCPRCLIASAASETIDFRPDGGRSGPSADRTASYPEFRASLLRTGLAEATDLEGLEVLAGGDATRLAVSLIRLGKLTPYQAGALVQGKSRGLLIGRYLILDRLGRGGMGVVFKARHRGTRQVVALKLLPPSFARDPDAVRRFRREFRVASHLDHPNLVAAIEADEDRGVHFLTMDYILGRDLETLVRQDGPMPVRRALHCGIQVARGLEAAHAQGVIHRDVKPGNVMIDAHGNVRVLDLGLAKIIEATSDLSREAVASITRTGSYMGTVDYLSPEQADNAKHADHRADIYSLGCTLHFLLTGRAPFAEGTLLRRLIAHQHEPPPSIRLGRPQVPEELEAIYLRMMAKAPGDRPASMSEVVAALESCRSSPREAGDASSDLKAFATTFMRRPEPRASGLDEVPSLFALPVEFPGLRGEPDLRLDRPIPPVPAEADPAPAPASAASPAPKAPAGPSRGFRVDGVTVGVACLVVALGLLAFAFWPRPGAVAVAEAEAGAPEARPSPDGPAADPGPGPAFSEADPGPAPDPAPGDGIGDDPPDAPGSLPTPEPEPEPEAGPAPPALFTLPLIAADEFDDPSSGYRIEETPVDGSPTPYRKGYAGGAYFMDAPAAWKSWEAWDVAGPIGRDFEFEAVARSLGPEGASGGFRLIVVGPEGRGFSVGITPAGRLSVTDSPWDEAGNNRYFEPFSRPAIRGGGEWNTVTLRVRRRSLEVLVNGESACEPIGTEYDLLPSTPEIAVQKRDDAPTRAEFDRVLVRLLDRGGTPPADDDGRALNLGFERGDLRDWVAEGAAMIGQPIEGDTVGPQGRDTTSGHDGRSWLGTYERGGDLVTGRLTSVPFRVAEPFASLLVSGGDLPGTRVEVAREDGPVIASFRGGRSEQLRAVPVDLSGHLGDRIVLRVVDDSSEPWGHLNYDDFRFHPGPPDAGPPGLSTSSRVVFTDDFEQPGTGWPVALENPGVDNTCDYQNGIYYEEAGRNWNGCWDVLRMIRFDRPFQVEVVGRVLGEAPNAAGGWGVMVVREDGRGVHAVIDRQSMLTVRPAFWGVDRFPDDRAIGPVRPRGIRPAGQFNSLILRVRNRGVEVLVNGVPAFERPIALDYDLLPASPSFTMDKLDFGTRIRTEFDRVQLRVLLEE